MYEYMRLEAIVPGRHQSDRLSGKENVALIGLN